MCRMIFKKTCYLLFFLISICEYKSYAETNTPLPGSMFSVNDLNNLLNIVGTQSGERSTASRSYNERYSIFLNMYCVGLNTYNPKETLKNIIPTLIQICKLLGFRNLVYNMFLRFMSVSDYMTGGLCVDKLLFWKIYGTVLFEYHSRKHIYINYSNGQLQKMPVIRISNDEDENQNQAYNKNNADVEKQPKDSNNDNIKQNFSECKTCNTIIGYLNESQYLSLDRSCLRLSCGCGFLSRPGGLYLKVLMAIDVKGNQSVHKFSYSRDGIWYNSLEDGSEYLKNNLSEMFLPDRCWAFDICFGYGSWEVVFSIPYSSLISSVEGNKVSIWDIEGGNQSSQADLNENQLVVSQKNDKKRILPFSIYIRKILYDSFG